MLVVEPINHIRRDERGVAWIADTNTKVIEVVLDHVAYGWDAKEIHAAHPHISVAQIHAALSHYYDHKHGFDAMLKQQLQNYERLRNDSSGQLTRAELQERLARK